MDIDNWFFPIFIMTIMVGVPIGMMEWIQGCTPDHNYPKNTNSIDGTKTIMPEPTIKLDSITISESQAISHWQSVLINMPLVNKTVLAKYKNRIIVAAYINDKGEWKLETNRKKVLGGKTIKPIKKWKEISK